MVLLLLLHYLKQAFIFWQRRYCRWHPKAFHSRSSGSLVASQQNVDKSWVYTQQTYYLLDDILDLFKYCRVFSNALKLFFSNASFLSLRYLSILYIFSSFSLMV